VLQAEERRSVRVAGEELAHAWGEPDHHVLVEEILSRLAPGNLVGLLGWRGMQSTTPFAPGNVKPALNMPWVTSGAIFCQRTYHPSNTEKYDPLANRVMGEQDIMRVAGKAVHDEFIRTGIRPLGIHSFHRVALYDGTRFVMLLVLGRAHDDRRFNAEKLTMVQELVPTLAQRLSAREALDQEPLAPGNVAKIANAIDGAAMIVAPGGHVVFANAMARAVYSQYPPWLEACASDEPDRKRPPWMRRVPLVLGQKRQYLLMPDVLELDPELAPSAPWARRWKLAPREAKVAACIVQGLGDKEVADRLGVTVSTARTYVKRLFSRANVHSRMELTSAILEYLLMPDVLELDPELAPSAPWARRWKLAPREAKVAACIVQGLGDKEVADRLGVTVSTARTYVKRLFSRANVHSRMELTSALLGVCSPDHGQTP